jgi:phosphate/sulfate permease
MSEGIIELLTSSWQQNTVIWLTISAVVGAIIAQIFKMIFENTITKWQQKRATRGALSKYHYPLTDATLSLAQSLFSLKHITRFINSR